MSGELAAIVLAGGRGSRLGGRDKAALSLAGERLVDRTVRAARRAGAAPIVVVGPVAAVPEGCIPAREDPPLGGPLAALAAGVAAVSDAGGMPEWVLLLSCDLVDPAAAVARIRGVEAQPGEDAIVLRDPEGRAQWLAARYRLTPLREALSALGDALDGGPLRAALAELATRFIEAVAADVADIDTPADLARAQERFETAVGLPGSERDPNRGNAPRRPSVPSPSADRPVKPAAPE